MSRNWLRRCTITLAGSSAVSIPGGRDGDLKIEFSIGASTIQTPNTARVRITNPNLQTVASFKDKEFQTLTIEAGYEDNIGLLYAGEIKQSLFARSENIVDSYIDIFCAEHANAYQQSFVNKSLAAGWTPRDQLQLALDAMKPHGITGLGLCNIDLDNPKHPRGGAFVGMARDQIRSIALWAGATFSMHQGKVHIINPNQPLTTDGPVVLNSDTGLIGFVHQTENGIIARCLINPRIKINTTVKIDEASIIGAERTLSLSTGFGTAGEQAKDLGNTGRIAADGLYRVAFYEVEADTRGQPWYQVLTCLAIGSTLNSGQLSQGLGAASVNNTYVNVR